MKKLVILFLCLLLSGLLQAKEIVVCATCETTTIKMAIELSDNGDTIRVKPGKYYEHSLILIEKSIKIIGEDYPVIDGQSKGTVFSIKAENVHIEGLKIINVGMSFTKEFAAILLSYATNFTLKNNIVENAFFGFLLEKSDTGLISGNTISGTATEEAAAGNGIHLWHTKNVKILDNKIFNMRDGIYLEFGTHNYIKQNTSVNNLRYGLHFMFSNNNEYHNNTFDSNGAGVAVMFSKNIKMVGNKFMNNWGAASYGLLLKEIYDAEITNNDFIGNTTAINADGSTRINYVQNNFKNNGYAVKVLGACYENVFSENNFMHNAFDVAYNGRINSNRFDNNYWTNYTGYDLDKDGIGDVSYRPVKLYSYLTNQTPEAIVLLRSLFVDLVDFTEKVTPIFTPADLIDPTPKMKKNQW